MEHENALRFHDLALKTIVVHTMTYSVMGMLAFTVLNYAREFARPELACWLRQTSDPVVMAGPLFQPIRGFIFALVFFPLRNVLFADKFGWLVMSWILIGVGVLSTFGPTPGSVEGMIYTRVPLHSQLVGWLEVVPQALLLSGVLCYWIRHKEERWLTRTLTILFVITLLLPIAGLLVANSAN